MDELRWILLAIAVIVIVVIYLFSRSRNRDQSVTQVDSVEDVPSFSANAEDDAWVDGVGPVRVVSQDSEADFELPETPVEQTPVDDIVGSSEMTQADSLPEDETPAKNITLDESRASQTQNSQPFAPQPLDPQEDEFIDEEVPVQQTDTQDAAIDDVIAVYVLAADEEPLIKGEKIYSACHALKLEYGEMKIFHRQSEDGEKKILFSMANIMEPGWFDVDEMHHLETRGVSFFMQVNLVDEPSRVLDDMLICAHGMSTMLGAKLCNPHRELLDEAYTNSMREKVKKLAQLKAGNH